MHVQGCAHTGRWWWLVLTTSGHKQPPPRPIIGYKKTNFCVELILKMPTTFVKILDTSLYMYKLQ